MLTFSNVSYKIVLRAVPSLKIICPALTCFEKLVDLLRDLLADPLHLLGLVAAPDLLVVLGDGRGRLPVGVGLELGLGHRRLVRGELVEKVGDPKVDALKGGNSIEKVMA